jgi:hypothetical protein
MYENEKMRLLKRFQEWGWGTKENDGADEFSFGIL